MRENFVGSNELEVIWVGYKVLMVNGVFNDRAIWEVSWLYIYSAYVGSNILKLYVSQLFVVQKIVVNLMMTKTEYWKEVQHDTSILHHYFTS